jgi:hypothetical protein
VYHTKVPSCFPLSNKCFPSILVKYLQGPRRACNEHSCSLHTLYRVNRVANTVESDMKIFLSPPESETLLLVLSFAPCRHRPKPPETSNEDEESHSEGYSQHCGSSGWKLRIFLTLSPCGSCSCKAGILLFGYSKGKSVS